MGNVTLYIQARQKCRSTGGMKCFWEMLPAFIVRTVPSSAKANAMGFISSMKEGAQELLSV